MNPQTNNALKIHYRIWPWRNFEIIDFTRHIRRHKREKWILSGYFCYFLVAMHIEDRDFIEDYEEKFVTKDIRHITKRLLAF